MKTVWFWQLWTLGVAHTGVGPDQSLSGPHRAHSKSRDQPRDRGGPLAEAEVGCGSGCVQGHLQLRPQGNIIIAINFIMFWFILLLVLPCFLFFSIFFLLSILGSSCFRTPFLFLFLYISIFTFLFCCSVFFSLTLSFFFFLYICFFYISISTLLFSCSVFFPFFKKSFLLVPSLSLLYASVGTLLWFCF